MQSTTSERHPVNDLFLGKKVWPRLESGLRRPGTVVGTRRCTLEGCGGVRLGVRWSKKRLTWPCLKGMRAVPGGWRIL